MVKRLHGPKPNNPVFTAHKEIDEIVEPLTNLYGLTGFSHNRLYWNGKIFSLNNNPEYVKYYYENNLDQYHQGFPDIRNLKILFVDDIDKNTLYYEKVVKVAEEQFNLYHGVSVIKLFLGYIDFYTFTVDKDNTTFNHRFLLQKDVFMRFINYYKTKARKLIKLAKAERWDFMVDKNAGDNLAPLQDDSQVAKEVMQCLDVKRYYLEGKFEDIYLTERERECLLHLANNENYHKIGKRLSISQRTVEYYIDNVKRKLQVNTRKKLLELLEEYNVLESLTAVAYNNDAKLDPRISELSSALEKGEELNDDFKHLEYNAWHGQPIREE